DGRLAEDPCDAPGRRPRRAREAARGDRGRRTGRCGRARVLRLRRRDPRPARPVPGGTRHRDRGCRPRGGVPAAHRRRGGRMSVATYIRYELLRTFRNRRFLVFSLGFPVVIYYLIAAP